MGYVLFRSPYDFAAYPLIKNPHIEKNKGGTNVLVFPKCFMGLLTVAVKVDYPRWLLRWT